MRTTHRSIAKAKSSSARVSISTARPWLAGSASPRPCWNLWPPQSSAMCYRDGPPSQMTRRSACCRLVLARPRRRACGPMSVMRDHGQARPRRQLSTASRATARASSRRSICRIIPAGCMRMDMLASMNSTARAASARSPAWLISGASLSMCSSRRAQ